MSKIDVLSTLFTQQLATWPPGRLPSVRDLASRHGASTRTIQAALNRLHAVGLLQTQAGAGLWRTGELPFPKPKPLRVSAQGLSDSLAHEIRSGLHAWESALPSIKEFAQRWACRYQTASSALELLVAKGMLERRGRLHFVPRPRSRQPIRLPTLLCLGAAGPDGRLRMETDRESDFWRALSTQAAQSGLSLVRHGWDGGKIQIPPSTVGVVASNWHLSDPGAMYQELNRLRLPVCAWMEDPSFQLRHQGKSRIHFHNQGYWSRIGTVVARHLLDFGHRHIAYLSPWHGSLWSRNRLKGIEEETHRRGTLLESFCLDGISEWDHLAPAALDAKLDAEFPSQLLTRLMEGNPNSIREAAGRELGWNRIRKDYQALLERANRSLATAWICANDTCALMAMDWLSAQGQNVPLAISVAGFDDTVAALRADLTSYRFNSDAMARAMVIQIISSAPSPAVSHHEGILVARGSTSKPAIVRLTGQTAP